MDHIPTEPVLELELILYGDIGAYTAYKYRVKPQAPPIIKKHEVMNWIQNYSSHTEEKMALKQAVRRLLPSDYKPLTGPIGLEIHHYRAIPKTKKKKVKPGDYVIVPPDESNLTKLIEDVLSGIVYEDDKQVARRPGDDFKVYDDDPRTEIRVYTLEKNHWI